MPAHGICWKIPQCVPTIATGNSPHLHRDSLRVSTSPIIHYEEDSPFPSLLEHDHLYTFYPGQLLQQAQTLVAMNKAAHARSIEPSQLHRKSKVSRRRRISFRLPQGGLCAQAGITPSLTLLSSACSGPFIADLSRYDCAPQANS